MYSLTRCFCCLLCLLFVGGASYGQTAEKMDMLEFIQELEDVRTVLGRLEQERIEVTLAQLPERVVYQVGNVEEGEIKVG